MLLGAFFFVMAFATLATLLWSGTMLLRDQEDPLGDRLEELQSQAMVVASRTPRGRRGGGGFLGFVLYVISLLGGEGWIRDNEKELNQAGIRNRQAVAIYLLFNIAFLLSLM